MRTKHTECNSSVAALFRFWQCWRLTPGSLTGQQVFYYWVVSPSHNLFSPDTSFPPSCGAQDQTPSKAHTRQVLWHSATTPAHLASVLVLPWVRINILKFLIILSRCSYFKIFVSFFNSTGLYEHDIPRTHVGNTPVNCLYFELFSFFASKGTGWPKKHCSFSWKICAGIIFKGRSIPFFLDLKWHQIKRNKIWGKEKTLHQEVNVFKKIWSHLLCTPYLQKANPMLRVFRGYSISPFSLSPFISTLPKVSHKFFGRCCCSHLGRPPYPPVGSESTPPTGKSSGPPSLLSPFSPSRHWKLSHTLQNLQRFVLFMTKSKHLKKFTSIRMPVTKHCADELLNKYMLDHWLKLHKRLSTVT